MKVNKISDLSKECNLAHILSNWPPYLAESDQKSQVRIEASRMAF